MDNIKKQLHATIYSVMLEQENYIRERDILYEGLLYSYEINHVIRGIKKFGFKEPDIVVEDTFGGKIILVKLFVDKNSKEKLEKINQYVENLCGWKFSAALNENRKVFKKGFDFLSLEGECIWLQYEPKFDIEINEEEVPPFLYHMTPENKSEKISNIGLIPKTKNSIFNYDDRIYFCDNVNDLFKLASTFVTTGDKKVKSKEDKFGEVNKVFLIYRLKIRMLTFPVRIFRDPNFEHGYYTLENIDSHVVKPYLKIELNDKGEIIKRENI